MTVDEVETGGPQQLSSWWRKGALALIVVEFAVLVAVALAPYRKGVGPPVPAKVVDERGQTLFTAGDILAGQQVFLQHGLMDNGSIWGHGAYLGPDFSAAYLHDLALDTSEAAAQAFFHKSFAQINTSQALAIKGEVASFLAENHYDEAKSVLTFRVPEVVSLNRQLRTWQQYFAGSAASRGLSPITIPDTQELRQLVTFFAWTAWAASAHRPGKTFSYTNNFPYDPAVGNGPTTAAIVWSALSLVALLATLALVLLAFGRFNLLGWRTSGPPDPPALIPGTHTPAERATLKFFVASALMLLAQVMVGGALAHYTAEPTSFYGFNLAVLLPSSVLRTWHLQLAIFWIATAFMGAGLFMASAIGKTQPKGQVWAINILFAALVVVVAGSLIGEWLGVRGMLGKLWFWLGSQGWEYLEIGRLWQVLLVVGFTFWAVLLIRGVAPATRDPEWKESAYLFLAVALAIPFFYLPAFFFGSRTAFTVADTWRFWIIHLWVEGFFELFATVMVALIFVKLGLVRQITARRVIYLDAILFLGAGILGTGHHWYWTGQTTFSMALSATFSAMEVVPLILLTLEAADFVGLVRGNGGPRAFPHKWAFYYLIAVGVWNFVGAGIFGFLINLPVVSYYEAGTNLTANHGHGALMGVFGMLALGFVVLVLRQRSTDEQWRLTEKLVAVSFWGFNLGLAGMLFTSLLPSGILQVADVINNGYWHARSPAFLDSALYHDFAWVRMPSDLLFILAGAVPLVAATALTYLQAWREKPDAGD